MNKGLTYSLIFSVGLHISTITLAREGVILQDYLYNPKDLIEKAMADKRQMSLLFVDSVAQDLKGDIPAKTNVVSDNDNAAQDRSLKKIPNSIAPAVEKVGSVQQLGDRSPFIGPANQLPVNGTEMMEDINVSSSKRKTPLSTSSKQGKRAHQAGRKAEAEKPAEKKQETPADKQEEKKVVAVDKTDRSESDILVAEKKPAADKAEAESKREQAEIKKKKDIVSLRRAIEEEYPEEEMTDDPGGEDGDSKVFGGSGEPRKRAQIALTKGSLKKLSSDDNGDVERFGDITFNTNKFALGHYFKKMKDKVEGYWIPYLAFVYSGGNFSENKTVVLFRIYPSGEVRNVKVLEHHGDKVLRDFCVSAITNTSPFDPLPETFLSMTDYGYLPIVFTFVY